MKKALVLLVCLLVFTSCGGNEWTPGEYISYAELPETYSLADAKADHCVVFEDSDITSGQAAWDDFLAKTQAGEPCMVRLAFHYTLGDPSQYSPELYEEMKDEYPKIFIRDLSFDGNQYILYYVERYTEYSFEYEHLKRFEGTPSSETATFSSYVKYALVHDPNVTWEQIEKGLVSSQFGAWIDYQEVYSDYTYKNDDA